MLNDFNLQDRLDWATGDAEDGARQLRKIFEELAFENENLDGEPPISELSDNEMKRLHTAESYLLQAARRISEIKTTLAILKGKAA